MELNRLAPSIIERADTRGRAPMSKPVLPGMSGSHLPKDRELVDFSYEPGESVASAKQLSDSTGTYT